MAVRDAIAPGALSAARRWHRVSAEEGAVRWRHGCSWGGFLSSATHRLVAGAVASEVVERQPAAMVPPARERVIVAMSGGVDSSLAAARLADAGHEVVGV